MQYEPKPSASMLFQTEISSRLNCSAARVHQPSPDEIPTAFVRRSKESPRRDVRATSPPPPEYQVLNRSVFVFASLGWKVGTATVFPVSDRHAPVARAVGRYTAPVTAASKVKTTYHDSRGQGKSLRASRSSPAMAALPLPGTCQILNQEDYRWLGLRPPNAASSPRASVRAAKDGYETSHMTVHSVRSASPPVRVEPTVEAPAATIPAAAAADAD